MCIIDKIYMASYIFSSVLKHQHCGITGIGSGNINCKDRDKDKDRQIQSKTIMNKSLVASSAMCTGSIERQTGRHERY